MDFTSQQVIGTTTGKRLAIVIAFWLVAVTLLSYYNFIKLAPTPLFGLTVFTLILMLTIAYFVYLPFRIWCNAIPQQQIIFLHIWRIPAGFTFLYYHAQGYLPEVFINNAAYGDIFVGTMAMVSLFLPANKQYYRAFHILGMLDFIAAVGTGLSLSLISNPEMVAITQFPIVYIPLFGVPLSGASHIISLYILFSKPKSDG